MPSFSDSQTIAAGATIANLMAGDTYEFLEAPANVELFQAADATGVLTDFSLGNVIEGAQLAVPVVAAGTGPIFNDGVLSEGVAAARDRIVVRTTNSTGAGIPVRTRVRIRFF